MNHTSKHIENYWIKDFPNGIRLLLFNTKERCVKFHQYDNDCYEFGDDEDMMEIDFPPFKNKESYLSTVSQNKDQISFYFIPFSLITYGKILK